MSPLPIPNENAPAKTDTELSKMEVADLTASKRNTILYQTVIEDLRGERLRLQEDNKRLEQTSAQNREQVAAQAKRLVSVEAQNTEMWVGSGLAACFLAIGGGLISTFPKTEDLVPWQFAVGWCFLGVGILTSVVIPVLVAAVHRVQAKFRAP